MIIPQKQLGFALSIAILIVVVLIAAGGTGYYFYKASQEEKEGEGISLKMDKTAFDKNETIKALVESKKMLFTGFPAFEIYQLVEGEWQWIDVYDVACALPCSANLEDICQELPIACAPLPEYCLGFDPSVDKFEWDQTILKTREVECPNLDEKRICSFGEMAEPGRYKVVFQYSENCVYEDFFLAEENNVQKIEKEFETLSPFVVIQ